jgi:NAD(P)-dependent dehydrogenase (short-subunit alcohol dehydrogenase family)
MIKFEPDQRFIVTGASAGIGKAICLLLNQLGATVIAIGRDDERLQQTKNECLHPGNTWLEKKDLGVEVEKLPMFVSALKAKYGKFHGLVYSAGAIELQPLQSLDYDHARDLFAVNYFGPVFLAKGFADRRNNVGRGASLVFISSIAALASDRGMVSYAGSKAALAASAKCIGRELMGLGIRVNTILPGSVSTDMTNRMLALKGEDREHLSENLGEPSDVAALTAFLLSDQAKWITCQNYIIDGGQLP